MISNGLCESQYDNYHFKATPSFVSQTHLDVLQQIFHVCGGEAVEEGVRFVHLHRQIIIFSTDVLSQQVDGLRSTITDSDLRSGSQQRL